MSETSADILRREIIETGQVQRHLAADHGKQWTTNEMTAEFEVQGFLAPYVVVRRRSDGKIGTLEFTGHPRVYFGWSEHTP